MTDPIGTAQERELIETAARAIYDAADSQSGDTVGTVIWNSEHLFYDSVEGEEIVDTARRASMPTCRDAARAAFEAFGVQSRIAEVERLTGAFREIVVASEELGRIDDDGEHWRTTAEVRVREIASAALSQHRKL